MSSVKEKICVYPGYCRFPSCKCDQPDTVRTYGFSGNGFYGRPKDMFPQDEPVSSSFASDNLKIGNSTLTFGSDGITITTAPKTPPSGGPTETKPVDPNRPRFLFTVDVGDLPKQKAEEFIRSIRDDFFKEYPHERTAATWIFVSTRSGGTNVVQIS